MLSCRCIVFEASIGKKGGVGVQPCNAAHDYFAEC